MGTRFAVVAMTLAAGVLLARCSGCTTHEGNREADAHDTYVPPSPEPEEEVHELPPGARVPPDPECFDQGMPACCACGTCTCDCTSDGECDDSNPCTLDHCGFAGNAFACEHRLRECPGGMACHRQTGTCQPAPYGGCDPQSWYEDCPDGTLCDYDTGLCEASTVEPSCLPPYADAWCPCTQDDDCAGSFCVEGPSGKVCSVFCVDTCPSAGWACMVEPGSCPDCIYLCRYQPSRLCWPCGSDADCNPPGSEGRARCVAYVDGESYCGFPCDSLDGCAGGYHCAEVAGVADARDQCVSDSATCVCDAGAIEAGASTPCIVSNDLGACAGRRTCTAEGLTACDAPVPAEEACNDLDDNCDGHTDEGFADSDANGVPDCLEVASCDEESPAADCDGDGVPHGEDNCPKVANPDQANWDRDNLGEVLGDFPGDACDPDDDNDGTTDADDCAPHDPAVYPGAVEVCDGKDNNCDGVTDEGFPQGCE